MGVLMMNGDASPLRRFVQVPILAIFALYATGCMGGGDRVTTAKIQPLQLNAPATPAVSSDPLSVSAAKNEWTSFQIQVSGLPAADNKTAYTLRLQALNLSTSNRTIAPSNYTVHQVLAMPVDVNHAGYIRHTGLSAATRMLPRALLPLPMNDGRVNLSAARDPNKPTDPKATAGTNPISLWIDLHVPPDAPAGAYTSVCEILQTGENKPIASIPVSVRVHDFVMPDERHLNLVGQIEWESLTRLYTNRFEAVTPRLMNRGDPRYLPAVQTLDQLVKLAQAHRVQVVVPAIQPTAKWPSGRPPAVSWTEFDSVVAPWLNGTLFDDKVPLGYWPLPPCESLYNYDPASQRQYWTDAATHFDQNDWLSRAPVFIDKATPTRANALETVKLSSDAAAALAAHPRLRVAVPLEDDQIQFSSPDTPNLIPAADAQRLITANPGVVFSSPSQSWPLNVQRPARWMRTDLTGLIPYVGAGGDERDVRLWAWLSSLPLPPPQMGSPYGPVQFIRWVGALPSRNSPEQPADPNELIWFYPGSWFGVDHPVPTVQLKWLRRAQQDYEYLYLLRQRGGGGNVIALVMARLMTKPVEIQPNQEPDPTYGLMSGTADPKAWDDALNIWLTRHIQLRAPGQPLNRDEEYRLSREMLWWSQPLERPVIIGRSTRWGWESIRGDNRIDMRLGIDIYNASDSTPDENSMKWSNIPPQTGWQVRPQPTGIPALATYHVRRVTMDAVVDPTRLRKVDRRPLVLTFTNGLNNETTETSVVLPVAWTDRREGMLLLNGELDDWTPDDAIQDGPLLRMLNRPALQTRQLEPAAVPTQIYTGWSEQNFYLAFKATGLSETPIRTVRNFVNTEFRRAWGEDLIQVLVQAVYPDNSMGPVLHIVCKPTGYSLEKKPDSRRSNEPWQAFEGTDFRYVATHLGPDWRGEMSIPWNLLKDPAKPMPVMLRFNFCQHRNETGESASWAGPIDFGKDNDFTGVLVLRELQTPGAPRVPGN